MPKASVKTPLTRSEELEAKIRKTLRKRDQKSLEQIGDEIGERMKSLTRPVSKLVSDGVAVKHPGTSKTPPTYTKA